MHDVVAVMRQMLLSPAVWERLTDEQIVVVTSVISALINPETVCDEIRKGMKEDGWEADDL